MAILLVLSLILPLLTALGIYLLKIPNRKLKNLILLTFSLIELIFASILLASNFSSDAKTISINFIKFNETLTFGLFVDNLASFFALLISLVFLIITIYSFEYMKHEENEDRFYLFFILSFFSLLGMCYARNLVSLYIFFELITLCSFPLVMHRKSKESIHAALKYLFYSILGAFLALIGLFYLINLSEGKDFVMGGVINFSSLKINKHLFEVIILLTIIGFGAKAGMFPLQSWLPSAHPVAPSNASAFLSGVIAKAGIFMVIRICFYTVGAEFIKGSWVQIIWIILSLITVLLGSGVALSCKNFKKCLAYSTVSQVSYIMFGLSLLNETAFVGSLLHVMGHMFIKVTLFLVAGVILYKKNYHDVEEMEGIGVSMPITMSLYSLASLGLVGVPPTLTFFSKYYLAMGAMEVNALGIFGIIILLISAILTAAYLLPIMIKGFFVGNKKYEKCEPNYLMLIPLFSLVVLLILSGIFANPIIEYIASMF